MDYTEELMLSTAPSSQGKKKQGGGRDRSWWPKWDSVGQADDKGLQFPSVN